MKRRSHEHLLLGGFLLSLSLLLPSPPSKLFHPFPIAFHCRFFIALRALCILPPVYSAFLSHRRTGNPGEESISERLRANLSMPHFSPISYVTDLCYSCLSLSLPLPLFPSSCAFHVGHAHALCRPPPLSFPYIFEVTVTDCEGRPCQSTTTKREKRNRKKCEKPSTVYFCVSGA